MKAPLTVAYAQPNTTVLLSVVYSLQLPWHRVSITQHCGAGTPGPAEARRAFSLFFSWWLVCTCGLLWFPPHMKAICFLPSLASSLLTAAFDASHSHNFHHPAAASRLPYDKRNFSSLNFILSLPAGQRASAGLLVTNDHVVLLQTFMIPFLRGFVGCRIASLLLSDDVVMLVSSYNYLTHSQFEISKSEVTVLSQKRVELPLRVGDEWRSCSQGRDGAEG